MSDNIPLVEGDYSNKEHLIIEMGVDPTNNTHTKTKVDKVDVPKIVSEPLWRTTEFYFYYLIILVTIPYMFYSIYQLSLEDHPNFQNFKDRLNQGWLFDRLVDNSDDQYRGFRNFVPYLALLLIFHVALSSAFKKLNSNWHIRLSGLRSLFGSPYHLFSLIFGLGFVIALHGYQAIKLLFLFMLNFNLVKLSRSTRLNPLISWTFNIVVLLLVREFAKVKFASISPILAFMDGSFGLLPRWHIHYNLSTLRLLSFNLDYYWCQPNTPTDGVDILAECSVSKSTTKERVNHQWPAASFTFVNYLIYLLYPPLYLAGPIITFNDFQHQITYHSASITAKYIATYALRLVGALVLMEFMLHTIYVQAIAKHGDFTSYSPFELILIGYFNLKFVWLKLLIIWRFFRLWALADGIDTIENMGRCMSNNYSIQGFWKGWHCSYNRFLVRYLYIPLGGSKFAYLNVWVIFTFVALWHDTELYLLTWGWLIALFFIPEMFASRASKSFQNKPYYRHLRAVGGTLNVVMLMTANLVGFVLHTDGFQLLLFGLLTPRGLVNLVVALMALFVAVQVMIEIRAQEQRDAMIARLPKNK